MNALVLVAGGRIILEHQGRADVKMLALGGKMTVSNHLQPLVTVAEEEVLMLIVQRMVQTIGKPLTMVGAAGFSFVGRQLVQNRKKTRE